MRRLPGAAKPPPGNAGFFADAVYRMPLGGAQ
jgi:hypothetical protein